MNYEEILTEIREIEKNSGNNKICVCVIGIGRIGLPTALSFAKSGFKTIGVDINKDLVNRITRKEFPLKDEPGYQEIFEEVINNGRFSATTKIEEVVPNSQIILLSLPTPMDKNNIPDYTALRTVAKQLKNLVTKGSTIIVESTIEPGFIENEFVVFVENKESQIIVGENIGVGVCPETANPGEIMKDFNSLPRLVAATDEKTSEIIELIYKHVFPVELIKMPNCKTANAVKLTTNVFRDVNIAFVNELALLYDKLGIDIQTVLNAADKKYNFQIHYPGAGVGGPCLPVNSYQMLNSAKEISDNLLKMVKTSREVNESMPFYVVNLLKNSFNEINKKIEESKILILGISYKPNVKDIQLSPAEIIISELKKLGTDIKIFDPFYKSTTVYGIKTANELEEVISDVDATIIVTAHEEFKNIKPEYFSSKMRSPILIDTRGIIDIQEVEKTDLIFRGLGRGKI
jgi:nucleotide sugar dehydrogenase